MKTFNYTFKFENYQDFLAYRRKLKGTPFMTRGYKYTEKIEKCVLSPVKDVVGYSGTPLKQNLIEKRNNADPEDWFPRLYTIKYQTTLGILPA